MTERFSANGLFALVNEWLIGFIEGRGRTPSIPHRILGYRAVKSNAGQPRYADSIPRIIGSPL